MVYCAKCGADNRDDALTCIKCGAPLTPPPVKEYRGRRWFSEEPRHGSMWSLFIGLFLILLGLSSLIGDAIPWLRFEKLWPLLIVLVGLTILYNAFVKRR